MNDHNDMIDSDTFEARVRLERAINKLRYAGSIFTACPTAAHDDTEIEFLDDVTQFIDKFNQVLATISDTTTSMAAELQDLRSQRKAVRDFLGLNTTEKGSTP